MKNGVAVGNEKWPVDKGTGYWFAPGVFSSGIGDKKGAVGKGPGKNMREEVK